MKKLITLLLILTLFSPLSLSAKDSDDDIENIDEEIVQVDENTRKVVTKYFDLTLERKPQSAFGKHVPYTLSITPHLDSSRTQILWNAPTTLEITPKHKEFVELKEGQTYLFEANIKPLRTGTYDFSVSVISWQHDTNYTNSIDDSLTFDGSLVLQPVSSQYQILSVVKILVILILFVLICIIAVRLVKRYMIKAKKWLTPPY